MSLSYAKYLYVKQNSKYYLAVGLWNSTYTKFHCGNKTHSTNSFKYFELYLSILWVDLTFKWKLSKV